MVYGVNLGREEMKGTNRRGEKKRERKERRERKKRGGAGRRRWVGFGTPLSLRHHPQRLGLVWVRKPGLEIVGCLIS